MGLHPFLFLALQLYSKAVPTGTVAVAGPASRNAAHAG
jgi:hypothetical protein